MQYCADYRSVVLLTGQNELVSNQMMALFDRRTELYSFFSNWIWRPRLCQSTAFSPPFPSCLAGFPPLKFHFLIRLVMRTFAPFHLLSRIRSVSLLLVLLSYGHIKDADVELEVG